MVSVQVAGWQYYLQNPIFQYFIRTYFDCLPIYSPWNEFENEYLFMVIQPIQIYKITKN